MPGTEDVEHSTATTWESLPKDSYTAQRLEHASPEHLHITSRRCFVGPIPHDWLRKHRKNWISFRPGFTSFSSRAPTFGEVSKAARHRAVTGLDDDSAVSKHKISFPQPDGLGDEDEYEEEEEGDEFRLDEDEIEPPEPLDDGTKSALEPVRSNELTRIMEEEPEPESGRHTIASPRDLQPAQEERAQKRPGQRRRKSLRSFRQSLGRRRSSGAPSSMVADSFVTARETLDGDEEQGIIVPEPPPVGGDATSKASSKKNLSAGHSPLLEGARSIDMTTPDSYHPQNASARTSDMERLPSAALADSARNESESSGTAQRNNSETMAGVVDVDHPDVVRDDSGENELHQDGVQKLAPAAANLVRFDLPDQPLPPSPEINMKDKHKKRRVLSNMRKRKQPGELLRYDRMLVRIDLTKHDLPGAFTEADSRTIEAQKYDEWREYIVACRRSSTDPNKLVLQLYKSRELPILQGKHTRQRYAYEIPLLSKNTGINVFNALDKTIAIWTPYHNDRYKMIYLFKARTATLGLEWLAFLKKQQGWTHLNSLTIRVPDMGLTVEIDRPFDKSKRLTNGKDLHKEDYKGDDEGGVARQIVEKAVDMLKGSEVAEILKVWFDAGEKVGLAWKRLERLEWLHGGIHEQMYGARVMAISYDLELRGKRHYPTQAKRFHPGKKSGSTAPREEPVPVEGFLVRLTSQKGAHSRLGKPFFKNLYFSTHNNFLCFCEPSSAIPPKPANVRQNADERTPSTSKIEESTPLIFGVTPYPIQKHEIKWLSEDKARFHQNDKYAYEEAARRQQLVIETQGYINLCHVAKVRKAKGPTPTILGEELDGVMPSDSEDEEGTGETDDNKGRIAKSFDLIFENGLIARLQAYDITTRKEWVKRLRKLIKYWKLRVHNDMEARRQLRDDNLRALGITEDIESRVGQFAEKWQIRNAIASAEVYNMCAISCCRSITMAGVIYRKTRMYGAFRKFNAILSHGKLLLFESTLRNSSGRAIPHIHHEREDVIDLADTYVYSGLITDNDLVSKNTSFDNQQLGRHNLPRVYARDNFTTDEDDIATCFVLWHGRRKSLFRSNQASEKGEIRQRLKYVQSLGTTGKSMVFMTRSRAERDLWVTNLNIEVERLQSDIHVRVQV